MAVASQERLLTTSKAIAEAIGSEMERDDSVFLMGEDVGAYGGIHGTSEGLLERFGSERIQDTPISETAFIGAAVGAALSGMRPIAELMFVDFFGVCMDQIYNHMAKIHYESGGSIKVPAVVMTAAGGGYGDGAQHSQTLWSIFAHLPGMKVVVPSSPYDAKGLMLSAIRDDNPVIYILHKGITGIGWVPQNPRSTGPVPAEDYTVPIGVAEIKRAGADVTIATIGFSVHQALDAAEILAASGIEAEILDLRSLVPLDRDTLVESVRKTGRLLVVDEDYRSFGMTGEIITTVVEQAFDTLSCPPARLALPDVSIPFSRPLENYVMPTTEKIVSMAQKMVGRS